MEEHVVGAHARPFVQAARGVRGEREGADCFFFGETEQARAGRSSADRAEEARRAEDARDVLVDQRPPEARHDLVAGDRRSDEVRAGGGGRFAQSEERGPDDDADMRHARRVHVFLHEAVRHDGVGESGIGDARALLGADERGCAATHRRGEGDRVAARRQVGCLRCDADHVEEAGLRLLDDIVVETGEGCSANPAGATPRYAGRSRH